MLLAPVDHPRYRLADHVRACRIDEQVVLLDLRRNKYIGVGGAQVAAMSTAVVDWPGRNEPAMGVGPRETIELGTLLEQRLLVPASHACSPPAAIEPATASLVLPARFERSAIECGRLARLCWSATVASIWLKLHCLADVATRVAQLRRNQPHLGHPRQAELRTATASYLRLRPFVFSAHDQCLRDSLTLVRFLAGEGLFPRWVVGVRTRPFGAHSWVQSEGLVLNDLHENVRAFTPILVV